MVKSDVEIVYVPSWLILGSLPNKGKPGLSNGIRGEAMLAPCPGDRTEGLTWRVWPENPVNFLDPNLEFKMPRNCFAYAFTYIHVTKKEEVELLAGSDDGIAIWVNQKRVHYVDAIRGMELDGDLAVATLDKGINKLLVKVSQASGGWAFVLRIRRKSPKGPMTFMLDRGIAGSAGGTAEIRPTAMLTSERTTMRPTEHGLDAGLDVQVFGDPLRRIHDLRLTVVDSAGAVYHRTAGGGLAPCGVCVVSVQLPQACFEALGEGKDLTIRIDDGPHKPGVQVGVGPDVIVGMFIKAMGGLSVQPGQPLPVPPIFRGQVARLEIVSAREQAAPWQLAARRPSLAIREYSPQETSAGLLSLDLPVPAGVTDAVACVYFGDEKVRRDAKVAEFILKELKSPAAQADRPAREGLAAIARGDFPAAAAALKDLVGSLAATCPDRSDGRITLVGHAHIDMNWLWTTSETRQVTHDTFRQALAFMEEFPQFCFSQSQSSTYEFIERIDPEMFEQIRRRVREGRWEVLGGMVDEGDTNLAGGEALARSLLMGQRYFQSRFGVTAKVGWLPDNFGHAAQLPQLLVLAGMGGLYASRCQPKIGPFVWEGVDGSQVINYVTAYAGEVNPKFRTLPEEHDPKHHKLLGVYGVGDHGGGPTRRDINRALFYKTVPGFPKVEFGTAAGFWRSLDKVRKDYPVYHGELQYVFEGCYTSVARIKEGNRRCENALYRAEMLACLAGLYGQAYPAATLRDAWHTVAFNQFHDILCGSATSESNREAVAGYDAAQEKAQEAIYGALRHLAACVPTADGIGQPVVVFNTHPTDRTDVVEAELFSYVPPPTVRLPTAWWQFPTFPHPKFHRPFITPTDSAQPYITLALKDDAGREVPAQIVWAKRFPGGYRTKVRFLAQDVPACGARLYYANPEKGGAGPDSSLRIKGTTIDTPLLKVVVDPKTGHVTRILDKRRKKEVLARGAKANALNIYMEKPREMSAWELGVVAKVITLDKAMDVRVVEHGPVRATIEVWRQWGQSTFLQRIIVYRDIPRVEFELEAFWLEHVRPDEDAPMLRVSFPLNVSRGRFFCDTPFAPIERPTTGREVPAQRWIDLSGAGGGAALLNDSKYGHRCEGNVLETSLLRATTDPDFFPDIGSHMIHYALLPHAGDFRQGNVTEEAFCFNQPMAAIETPPGQDGPLPVGESLLALSPGQFQLTAVKQAEDGHDLIIRFYESFGRPGKATVALPRPASSVRRVNLLEEPLDDAASPEVEGSTVRLSVQPHEIVSLRVRP